MVHLDANLARSLNPFSQQEENSMARQFIKDSEGNDVKNSNGERLFWSKGDGDPPHRETVYREHKDWFLPGATKTDTKYDPSSGKFRK
jgi:hypothetical protein